MGGESVGTVNVPGLGTLPRSFRVPFDGFNIDQNAKTNGHHEGFVTTSCNRSEIFRDHFHISGNWSDKDKTYTVSVDVNSEIGQIDFWENGRVQFTFAQGHWGMKGFVSESGELSSREREWRFCDPDALLRIFDSGFACFEGDPQASRTGYTPVVSLIRQSIARDRNFLIATASRYMDAADCSASPPADTKPLPMRD